MRKEFTPVVSSNIESFRYDEEKEELQILFLNGGLYVYEGVSGEVFSRFLGAPSKGRFVATVLKGKYPTRRLA